MKFQGKTYTEIINSVQNYLEHPPMIALPGGSWCPFCGVEICRNFKHGDRQLLLLAISNLCRDLDEARK